MTAPARRTEKAPTPRRPRTPRKARLCPHRRQEGTCSCLPSLLFPQALGPLASPDAHTRRESQWASLFQVQGDCSCGLTAVCLGQGVSALALPALWPGGFLPGEVCPLHFRVFRSLIDLCLPDSVSPVMKARNNTDIASGLQEPKSPPGENHLRAI